MSPRSPGALAAGLGLLVAACGSQAHADRNNAQIDAQLNAVSATMPEGAGRDTNALDLGPSAADVGGKMRSAAANPPPPR